MAIFQTDDLYSLGEKTNPQASGCLTTWSTTYSNGSLTLSWSYNIGISYQGTQILANTQKIHVTAFAFEGMWNVSSRTYHCYQLFIIPELGEQAE